MELLERALARDGPAVRLTGLRAKYGYRCLQTGLTFFDPYVSSPDWEPYPRAGLSSQVGLEAEG